MLMNKIFYLQHITCVTAIAASPPKPIVADYLLGGASSLLFPTLEPNVFNFVNIMQTNDPETIGNLAKVILHGLKLYT